MDNFHNVQILCLPSVAELILIKLGMMFWALLVLSVSFIGDRHTNMLNISINLVAIDCLNIVQS